MHYLEWQKFQQLFFISVKMKEKKNLLHKLKKYIVRDCKKQNRILLIQTSLKFL